MEFIGWLGFVLIQLFYLPQIRKTLRTRDVQGLSLPAWVVLWLGILSYLVYSVWRRDRVFVAGNAMGLLLTSLQIGPILKYRT